MNEDNIFFVLFFVSFMFILQILLRYFLSHKKLHIKKVFSQSFKQILIMIPILLIFMIFFSNNHWFSLVVTAVMLFLIIIISIYNSVKKRDSIKRYLYSILVYIPLFMMNFFQDNPIVINILAFIPLPMALLYFVFLYRYPFYSQYWVEGSIDEILSQVEKGCGYSPKPITVFKSTGKRFITGCRGLKIMFREEKTIVRMSRKYHKACGSPNLKEFSDRITEKIIERYRGEADE